MSSKKEAKVRKEVVVKGPTKKNDVRFSKLDVLSAEQFTRIEKDFLVAYLADDQLYTVEQAKEVLSKKLKGVIE